MSRIEQNTLIVLTPGFAANEADSTCLPMQQNLLLQIKKTNPALNIIVLAFQYPYCVNTYYWFGVKVMSFNGQNKAGIPRLLLRRKIYKALSAIHADRQVMGILSFWYGECALVGKKFADKYNLIHRCWLLGQDAKKENKYPSTVKAAGNELVALSDFLHFEFERNHYIKPAHIIPSGGYGTGSAKPNRDIDIIAVGSLIPLKRYAIFLEMLAKAKTYLPSIKTMLVGDGPEKESLLSIISTLGLQNNCVLTGAMDHAAVMKLMVRSKILLHPSSYEGFSGVCQEALYHGAHVISFCRAMKVEIDQWHIVADANAMSEKIRLLLTSPGTTYKKVNPFPMEETAIKILQLFDQ